MKFRFVLEILFPFLFLTSLCCVAQGSTPVLISIAVSPQSPSVTLGAQTQFMALGTYSDGSSQDLTALVSWNSANNAVVAFEGTASQVVRAQVAAYHVVTSPAVPWQDQGLATSLGVGQTTVHATLDSVSSSAAVTVSMGAAQPSFLGMHFNPANPVSMPYGKCRIWGVRGAYWADIEPSPGVYDFSVLDEILATAKQSGIDDGCIFTFGYVPQWASRNPGDDTCDRLNETTGSCWLPPDVAFDGSGTDQTMIDAIRHIAAHVNDPVYLQSHAHVRYWEPFNEPYRSRTLSGTNCSTTHTCSYNGSYAQLVRIAEDMRCVIMGVGSANGVPCSRTPIDSSAAILTPSGETYFEDNGRRLVWNFLNCDQNPRPGSGCTTGGRGSAATDVVNFHCYVWNGDADDVATYIAQARAFLNPADAAKPFFCDEGSWATTASLSDPDLQAGFIARWYVAILSQQVTTALWFAFDNQGWGTLWNPKGKNGCSQSAGCLTKAGVAYSQVHDWLVGATLQGCVSSVGVTSCSLTRPGYSALMIWNALPLAGCSGQISPQVCGSTLYSVPAGYTVERDLGGGTEQVSGAVYVGAKPILLEKN